MLVRDAHATLDKEKSTFNCPSDGVDIIADDGRALFSIYINKDGSIDVRCSGLCRHNGEMLSDKVKINPTASNCFYVMREPWKE